MERSQAAIQAYCPLFFKDGTKIIPVHPFDIKLIESDRDYVKIVTANGKKFLKRSTLEDMEKKLVHHFFCRVGRSFIVNVHHIKEINQNVISFDDRNVPLQKQYAMIFMQRFLLMD